jgi:hypothetical protein
MNLGNQKVYYIGNNSYIDTEHKKLYPTQVLLFQYPPNLLKSIPVLISICCYHLTILCGWSVCRLPILFCMHMPHIPIRIFTLTIIFSIIILYIFSIFTLILILIVISILYLILSIVISSILVQFLW